MSVDQKTEGVVLTRRDVAAIEYEHGSRSAEIIAKMQGTMPQESQHPVGLFRGMPNQEHISTGRTYSHGRYNTRYN